MTRSLVVATLALFTVLPTGVRAGIADSPLPVLVAGQTTLHLYSVPGVTDSGGLGTYFTCTSTDTAAMQVCVEVFGEIGGAPISNDCSSTSLSVAPGATVKFGTRLAAGLTVNSNVAAGGVANGSARVLATSKKLVCTAFIADAFNAPPTSMVELTIIANVKQKAAN